MTTVSIVLYKNSLEQCYTVLEPLVNSVVERIFLVDHSGNNKLEVLAGYSPKITYIQHKNKGYGAGHNVALKEAFKINPDGFHLVMNPDIILLSDDIRKLEHFMFKYPTIGCCMPRILNINGTNQRLCKYLPSPMDLLLKRFCPWLVRDRIKHLCMGDCDYDKILSVPWISGCFMFMRIEAFQRIGGFDERFFLYAEDIDLSRRIHLHYETIYCPEVTVTHLHQAGSYHSLKLLLIHIASTIHYFNKWGGWFDSRIRDAVNNKARERNKTGIDLPHS